MGFEGDKVAFERIYWDQASLLAQVGLVDETVLPVTGGAFKPRRCSTRTCRRTHLLQR